MENLSVYANNSNLVATDHLGRTLPSCEEAGEKKDGKVVALFYYLWHGYHGTQGPYDITKILEKDPKALEHPYSDVWPDSSLTPMLHWGEPMFGYYVSQDEWVLRRHVQMFIDAGVDVLFFDVTNGFTYRKAYLKLFNILSELTKKGFKAPKVAFYLAPGIRGCGTGNMMDLWEQLYEPRLYPELYFYWKGKPLIVCHSIRSLPDEIRDFFTWRSPVWGAPDQPNMWAWSGNPQKVAVDENGAPEEIAVNVCRNYDGDSFGASMSEAYFGAQTRGRSWHDGHKDTRENASQYGFLFQEQAEFALKSDVPVSFICQWNEWLVPFLTKATNTLYPMEHEIRLQDEYNEEYSRDVEPMKGGYKDAYYLQMTSFIRRFKGMEKPASADRLYSISKANDWEDVMPVYKEYTGDVVPRNYKAYDAIGKYTNYTGRNEFMYLKVASDRDYVCFYAECSENISPVADKNRMMLFIKIPGLDKPSWEGYNFVVNHKQPKDKTAYLEKCASDGKFEWVAASEVYTECEGKKLWIKIPRSELGIGVGSFKLEFKWSDNMQESDVMDFYQNGDAAPRGRMNYLYILDI